MLAVDVPLSLEASKMAQHPRIFGILSCKCKLQMTTARRGEGLLRSLAGSRERDALAIDRAGKLGGKLAIKASSVYQARPGNSGKNTIESGLCTRDARETGKKRGRETRRKRRKPAGDMGERSWIVKQKYLLGFVLFFCGTSLGVKEEDEEDRDGAGSGGDAGVAAPTDSKTWALRVYARVKSLYYRNER